MTGRAGPLRPPAARALRATAATLGLASSTALALHVLPAGTWLATPRRAFFPALAGVGRPDHVALTFDDGPDDRATPHFLAALDRLQARATFFVLGERLLDRPALGREIVAHGHELAVHGWTHSRPWLPAPGRDTAELARAVAAVRTVSGRAPRWYRPPYGILTAGRLLAARRVGLRPVLWSAWGRDWTQEVTPESVLRTVGRDLAGGGTVLLHDSDHTAAPGCWRATLAALPALVEQCRSAGLTVGPLDDHGVLPAGRPRPRAGSGRRPGLGRPAF
ncbi:polysaccharide deacetylase family protein [Streptomyces sp. NPDC059740]|uniref:polysaccharide deacetylase family protein n=1 Tax=Streptomyces sp. NPDC059740 TaxID=3346926 RepID=UPI0036567184